MTACRTVSYFLNLITMQNSNVVEEEGGEMGGRGGGGVGAEDGGGREGEKVGGGEGGVKSDYCFFCNPLTILVFKSCYIKRSSLENAD